jgi:hypothetical protein
MRAAAFTAASATSIACSQCSLRTLAVMALVRPAGVEAVKEEASSGVRILPRSRRLELASKLQQVSRKLRLPTKLEVPKGAVAFLPERAQLARARLNLAEAFLHPATVRLHVTRLTVNQPQAIGAVADASQ